MKSKPPDKMFTSNHAELRLKALNSAKRVNTCDSKMYSLKKIRLYASITIECVNTQEEEAVKQSFCNIAVAGLMLW